MAYGLGSAKSVVEEEKPKVSIKERITKMTDTATAARLRLSKKNYFESGKRGEVFEWKQDLNSENELVKKETVKKVIAAMTIGKDVSALFPHMLKCLYTRDVELKKLVYHYLIHYSSSNPELAILAINTFCKDCENENATIRALAVRTMALIRVDCIAEYLTDPLTRLLKDEHPFVRKTAVLAVAKFFETMPEVAADFEFDGQLRAMLETEINSTVMGAIVSALGDVWCTAGRDFEIPSQLLPKYLRHLPECNEWSQIALIECLTRNYKANAENQRIVLQAVMPYLQHQNEALVLVACKYILLNLPTGQESEYLSKVSPALVSLLSAPQNDEMLYLVLKNVQEFSRLVPASLLVPSRSFRLLVPKYSDASFIKRERLACLPQFLDEDNFDAVVVELTEEAKMEVDPEIVAYSVQALVRCALQLNGLAAPLVIGALAGLVRSGVAPALWQAAKELVVRFGPVPELALLIGGLLDAEDEQVAIWDEAAVSAMVWVVGECGGGYGLDLDILSSSSVVSYESLLVARYSRVIILFRFKVSC